MSTSPRSSFPESEEQLVALLATLKVEQVKEADFEGRFLEEFHERVARETVCCPARRRLFDHIMQMLENIGRGRQAFGVSAAGRAIVAVAFALYPTEQVGGETAAALSGDKYKALPQLPALSHDLADCTSIRVQQTTPENTEIMVSRGAHTTIIQIPNSYVPAQRPAADFGAVERGSAPVSLPSSSVRYAF